MSLIDFSITFYEKHNTWMYASFVDEVNGVVGFSGSDDKIIRIF